MEKFILDNGLTVISQKKPIDTVTVQCTVKVGSNYETKKNNGISHFMEHMLFEGTKRRPDARAISNEIESIGGDLNAYTSSERTCFFIRVPKEHYNLALDIMADMLQNSVFDKEKLEKERKVILKEVNLHKDDPRFHQWILFSKALFGDYPAGLPTYGLVGSVKKITRTDLQNFFIKFYQPSNTVLSIVGNIPNDKNLIRSIFSKKANINQIIPKTISIASEKKNIIKEKRKVLSSYYVLGYKTAPRKDEDSYVLDVIRSILGRGQSGRLFDEIRNKHGLAYEVGVHHDPLVDYGVFAVYFNTDKENLKKITELIRTQFDVLKGLSDKELNEAKNSLIGQHIMQNDDPKELADSLGFWELIKDAALLDRYLDRVKKVTKKDVARVAHKYLTENYSLSIIEQR